MVDSHEVKRLASQHLAAEDFPWVVSNATYDSRYRVWSVGYVDPEDPAEQLIGGGLVVTDEGDVHRVSSAPGAFENLMYALGRFTVDEIDAAYEREGEALALLADVDREEADGLAAHAASRRDYASDLPADWRERLADELQEPYWAELQSFVASERRAHDVFPPADQTFAAFHLTPFDKIRVVILGQDPYPNPGEAHGLAFSAPSGVPVPPSLANIHKELLADRNVPRPPHGDLTGWAKQGVLLLNTALTVRAGTKADRKTHRAWRSGRKGWTTFTDAVISAISAGPKPVVFILWGADARRKVRLIETPRHAVISAVHPSPLSANRGGFFGTKPFSEADQALRDRGREEIDWARFA